jgi:hypothetical protein
VRIDAGTLFAMGCLLAGAGSLRRRFAKPQQGCTPTKFSSKTRPSLLENTLQGIGSLLRSNHFERILDVTDQLDNIDREEGAKTLRLYANDMLKIADGLWPDQKVIIIEG